MTSRRQKGKRSNWAGETHFSVHMGVSRLFYVCQWGGEWRGRWQSVCENPTPQGGSKGGDWNVGISKTIWTDRSVTPVARGKKKMIPSLFAPVTFYFPTPYFHILACPVLSVLTHIYNPCSQSTKQTILSWRDPKELLRLAPSLPFHSWIDGPSLLPQIKSWSPMY